MSIQVSNIKVPKLSGLDRDQTQHSTALESGRGFVTKSVAAVCGSGQRVRTISGSSVGKPVLTSKAKANYLRLKKQGKIVPYEAPEWAKCIAPHMIPKEKLVMSHDDTPVQKWELPEVPKDFNLYIKREDLNGNLLAGNKIKKLEFSLAKAIKDGCDHILTTGTAVSNHCRTAALCCSELKLKCTLLQTCDEQPENILTKGNLLPSLLSQAKCVLLPGNSTREEVNDMLDDAFDMIKKEGDKPYMILRGGTQADGVFGYIEIFRQMLNQPNFKNANISDIVVTSGSGGTAISLAIANKLAFGKNSQIRVHGMRVWGDRTYGMKMLKKEVEEIGLNYEQDFKDTLVYHDEFVGAGYGVSKPEIEDTVLSSIKNTGISLCTTYTGKATYGMLELMKNKPEAFKGKNVLFMHTGGIPGLWGDSSLHRALENDMKKGDKIMRSDAYFGN